MRPQIYFVSDHSRQRFRQYCSRRATGLTDEQVNDEIIHDFKRMRRDTLPSPDGYEFWKRGRYRFVIRRVARLQSEEVQFVTIIPRGMWDKRTETLREAIAAAIELAEIPAAVLTEQEAQNICTIIALAIDTERLICEACLHEQKVEQKAAVVPSWEQAQWVLVKTELPDKDKNLLIHALAVAVRPERVLPGRMSPIHLECPVCQGVGTSVIAPKTSIVSIPCPGCGTLLMAGVTVGPQRKEVKT